MPEHKNAQLIYRGSRDGFKTAVFLEKSYNISPSFVLIKSKEHQQTFGWYTNIPWEKTGNCYKKLSG